MKKIIIQGLIIIASFFVTWFLLKQVNWMKIFKVEQITKSTDEKLGDLFWDMISKTEKEIYDLDIKFPVDSILKRICTANSIDKDRIKVHIIESDEINAFALPNNHLVIYTSLLKSVDNESELAGVMSHEIAHLELDHVMKKLVKEFGLSILISMTANGNAQAIKDAIKNISSTAYDRNLEKEADIKAVDYLSNAKVNPEGLANFLYKINKSNAISEHLTWISTHPGAKERSEYIIEYAGKKSKNFEPILTDKTWENLKSAVTDLDK